MEAVHTATRSKHKSAHTTDEQKNTKQDYERFMLRYKIKADDVLIPPMNRKYSTRCVARVMLRYRIKADELHTSRYAFQFRPT